MSDTMLIGNVQNCTVHIRERPLPLTEALFINLFSL